MSIDPATSIASVHLTVANLARSLTFYQERLGLLVHRQANGVAALGAGDADLLVLHESPPAPPRRPGTTGLYHFAIVVPTRIDLARALRRLVGTRTMMQGFADHLVSEAIYLADPDGNGIEIYRDRPRQEWPYVDGRLQMGTEPLDVDGLLAAAGADRDGGLPEGTRMGHVHLQVSNLDDAERFFREAIGFDLLMRYGSSAAFLSAGGYHHHIAVNTWAGAGAPAPPSGSIGLRHVVVRVPSPAALAGVRASLEAAGVPNEENEHSLAAPDSSGNLIVVTVAEG
jgi:catechol 2,3-dioxygenase